MSLSLKLFLILTFFIIGRPQDFFHFLQPFRPVLLLFAGTLLVSFFNNETSPTKNITDYSQIKRYYFFYFLMIVGIPFSIHKGRSLDFVTTQYLNNIIFFYFFIVHIDSIKKLEKVIYTLCFSNFFYATLCMVNAGFNAGRFRYGTMYDPNDLAYFLISLFPLSFYILLTKSTALKKIIAVATITISLIITVMTGSRGGLIGLLTVFLLVYFTKFSLLKTFQKVVLLLIITIALTMNMDKIDMDRYSTLVDIESDYNVEGEFGRMMVWQRGIELTLQNPIMGVGINCFPEALGYYRQQLGLLPKWQTAHNSFVLVLTELGFIGFLVFALLIIKTFVIYYNCAKRDPPSPDLESISMMSKVIIIAFVGHLVCSFFLSMSYSVLFTLFFAMSVTIQNCCRKTE